MHKIFTLSLILFSLQALAFEGGDKCSNPKNLPSHFTCFDGEIYDCNNQNQGRMGYVACGSAKVDKLRTDLPKTGAPIYLAGQELMNDLAGFNIHRGCLALVRRPQTPTLDRIAAGPLARLLLLEGVNNPDNVGGLFRSAAAFGIELVVLGPHSGDPLYRKAIRTSMGATLSLPFAQAPQWPGAIADLRADGFTVVALTPALTAAPLEEIFPHAKLALLVGSEGAGLTEAAMRAATLRIRIPTTADVDSLNVTIAASIAMYHCFAERRQ